MKTPYRIEVWVTEEIAAAVKAVADAQFITESAVGRQALAAYLGSIGALPLRRQAAPNGQPQEASHV